VFGACCIAAIKFQRAPYQGTAGHGKLVPAIDNNIPTNRVFGSYQALFLNILSIQSQVAYGHVGNAAAVFALQRLGHDVWPVPTVEFSNHPAHGGYGGRVNGAGLISGLVDGLKERGFLGSCDAVLSGYMGSIANGATSLLAVETVRAQNPDVVYVCDPVFGHAGRGIFVAEGLPEFFRDKAVPAADILTPNQFELEWLTGRKISTLEDALAACAEIRARGPHTVLCTSLTREDGAEDVIETLLVTGEGAWLAETGRLQGELFGAGDLFAALYLGHHLRTSDPALALSQAVSGTWPVLEATVAKGGGELALIAAQDEMVRPTRNFDVQRVR
jgi:pyridoxine kinase